MRGGDQLLAARGVRRVDFADWQRLDRLEVARGAASGRPRVKLGPVAEMLAALEAVDLEPVPAGEAQPKRPVM